jgi:chromosome segregation ATPase
MQSLPRELPTVDLGLLQRELELRARLSAAHLEAQETRSLLIDAERSLARYQFRADAAEKTIPALSQQSERWEREARGLQQQLDQLEGRYAQLRAERNAILSSRWWRLGNKIRAALRRIARPLPPRVKGALRAVLRSVKRALPA